MRVIIDNHEKLQFIISHTFPLLPASFRWLLKAICTALYIFLYHLHKSSPLQQLLFIGPAGISSICEVTACQRELGVQINISAL